jgi:hypothetical protein
MIIAKPNRVAAEIHDRMPVFLTEQQSAEQQFAPCRAGAESESGAEQQSATLANIEAGHSSSGGADDQILTEVTTCTGLRRAPVRPPGH